MEIINFSIYRGRNIYSHFPVIKMIVDIGRYYNTPTKNIAGFNEKLLRCFPNLRKNTCGLGYEGGFLERLKEGTYLGHVLEHVILDLQNSLGFDIRYGKTRLYKEPSQYYLVFEYENEICALECGKVALFILNSFLHGHAIELSKFMEYLNKIKRDTQLGPSTAAIVCEAKKRNIPVHRIGYESLVRLGYGKNSQLIQSTLPDMTSCIAADIACDKHLTKAILDDHQVPVPYGKVVYTEISAVMAARQIGMPVVVKPFDGNQGKGVSINLMSDEEVKKAFQNSSQYSSGVIVEKYIEGNDYRILVIGGQVKAVARRKPATITGDGVHTIRELVDRINLDPARGEYHEKSLTKIEIDNMVLEYLDKMDLGENSVLERGRQVVLRSNGNISTGGTAEDCTDIIHPDNVEIAVNAANAIGIDIAGIDMVAADISESIRLSKGAVIEVNATPGIRMHLYPSQGKPRNVAKDILDFLFPKENVFDFPIVSVTGTNGKTTTVRLISHVLSLYGKTVGMTSTSGTFIGEKCICKGDNSGPRSARALLANKQIDAAVLETARGGIIREGLGYDLADVGIVTNVTDDHLGIDGIDSLEDLAFVKSLVAEAVKIDGYAVLNAEDNMTNLILKRLKSKVMLFYKNEESIVVDQYLAYPRVFLEGGDIVIFDENIKTHIVCVKQIPATCGGSLTCNIENCLAAVCALYALKVPPDVIARGLMNFQHNPGRFQIFAMQGYRVMLDYAHNPAGYREVLTFCKNQPCNRLVGVIGVPGDRTDQSIEKVGHLAAQTFDFIYIKEDHNLRDREKQEVADLLYQSVIKTKDKERMMIAENEIMALQQAMAAARQGDFIVVLYEKWEPLFAMLQECVPHV